MSVNGAVKKEPLVNMDPPEIMEPLVEIELLEKKELHVKEEPNWDLFFSEGEGHKSASWEDYVEQNIEYELELGPELEITYEPVAGHSKTDKASSKGNTVFGRSQIAYLVELLTNHPNPKLFTAGRVGMSLKQKQDAWIALRNAFNAKYGLCESIVRLRRSWYNLKNCTQKWLQWNLKLYPEFYSEILAGNTEHVLRRHMLFYKIARILLPLDSTRDGVAQDSVETEPYADDKKVPVSTCTSSCSKGELTNEQIETSTLTDSNTEKDSDYYALSEYYLGCLVKIIADYPILHGTKSESVLNALEESAWKAVEREFKKTFCGSSITLTYLQGSWNGLKKKTHEWLNRNVECNPGFISEILAGVTTNILIIDKLLYHVARLILVPSSKEKLTSSGIIQDSTEIKPNIDELRPHSPIALVPYQKAVRTKKYTLPSCMHKLKRKKGITRARAPSPEWVKCECLAKRPKPPQAPLQQDLKALRDSIKQNRRQLM